MGQHNSSLPARRQEVVAMLRDAEAAAAVASRQMDRAAELMQKVIEEYRQALFHTSLPAYLRPWATKIGEELVMGLVRTSAYVWQPNLADASSWCFMSGNEMRLAIQYEIPELWKNLVKITAPVMQDRDAGDVLYLDVMFRVIEPPAPKPAEGHGREREPAVPPVI